MFPFRRFLVRRAVVINLDDGTAIQGHLVSKSGPLLLLKAASLLIAGTAPAPLDGDVVIERRRVLFIQAP